MPGLNPFVTEDVRSMLSFNALLDQQLKEAASRENGQSASGWVARSFLPGRDGSDSSFTDAGSTTHVDLTAGVDQNTVVGNKTFTSSHVNSTTFLSLLTARLPDRKYFGFWGVGDQLITNSTPTMTSLKILSPTGNPIDWACLDDSIMWHAQELPIHSVFADGVYMFRQKRIVDFRAQAHIARVADIALFGRTVDELRETIDPAVQA